MEQAEAMPCRNCLGKGFTRKYKTMGDEVEVPNQWVTMTGDSPPNWSKSLRYYFCGECDGQGYTDRHLLTLLQLDRQTGEELAKERRIEQFGCDIFEYEFKVWLQEQQNAGKYVRGFTDWRGIYGTSGG